jgi:succinyl-CoA synthetase beta subunit
MKIHEFQAKDLFRRYQLPVPAGGVAETPEEAQNIAAGLSASNFVVKAQIHAGGRGKGGGVKRVESPAAAAEAARTLLGRPLITPQTGPAGQIVRRVLVEAAQDFRQEYYVGLTIDRNLARPAMMVSPAGGMDIEEVAAKSPEKIFKETVDPLLGFRGYQGFRLAEALGWNGKLLRDGAACFARLYRLFVELDASLVEINPLVVTSEGAPLALDAKITFDDNGLFRHPEIKELLDPDEMDPLELQAGRHGLNYIRLDGNIGAMVNGAGLAMATMDLIKQAGAAPANFLDVGGGANVEAIAQGFRIILSDERVKALLINIFGGILRCDVFAQGVVEAAGQVKVDVPIIVRLEGTNMEEGQRILGASSLNFAVAHDLKEAARKVAELVR